MTAKDNVLFGAVEFDGFAQTRVERVKVDVPKEIIDLLTQARTDRKRPVWPVRDEAHYDAMANVLYSAGDILGASVVVAPLKRDGKKVEVLKREQRGQATHVRATVGAKRGAKSAGDKAAAEAASVESVE